MLGDLSAKYESNGDCGTISNSDGDAGGKSYGSYQFAMNAGVPEAFVEWLNDTSNSLAALLTAEPGSVEFDVQWKGAAQNYNNAFQQAQWGYVKAQYFDAAVANLQGIGYDVMTRSEAMQQVLWSRAVQYSPHYMPDLWQEAVKLAGQDLSDISDHDLIYNIYEVNLTDPDWTSGSPDERPGLFARFNAERDDALAMLPA
ncbi:MAG: hypothetical protein P4N59_03340 [Negativicutes bacterium]|nr:hypothetical protein [Negativicutes bacterium]